MFKSEALDVIKEEVETMERSLVLDFYDNFQEERRRRRIRAKANRRAREMKPTIQKDFPQLKAVDRISKIPVIESGYNYATELYNKIKKSNGLVTWSLNSAEAGVMLAVEITLPAVLLLEAPLHTVDNILCRSLDIVEERVPAIHYPPKIIYNKTKDYVSTKVVQPVLKRADSVKQISLHNASKYGEMAATRLDNALDVADKYVDKYLPDVSDNPSDNPDSTVEVQGGSRTAKTIHHVNLLSRKLQRRLTRRTIAEARALKQQSADTLQCLIYLADLLARDPKAFIEKARKMWEHLSEDEPENQVPPANLEQLIAMLTREVARRVVHLVNYTGATVSHLPQRVRNTIHVAAHNINSMADYVLRKVHLESMKVAAVAQARLQFVRAQEVLTQIRVLGINLLENVLSRLSTATHRIQSTYPIRQIAGPKKSPSTPTSGPPTPTKNSTTPSPQSQNSNCESMQSSPKTSKSNSPKEQLKEQNNSASPKKKEKEQEKAKEKSQSPPQKTLHTPEDSS